MLQKTELPMMSPNYGWVGFEDQGFTPRDVPYNVEYGLARHLFEHDHTMSAFVREARQLLYFKVQVAKRNLWVNVYTEHELHPRAPRATSRIATPAKGVAFTMNPQLYFQKLDTEMLQALHLAFPVRHFHRQLRPQEIVTLDRLTKELIAEERTKRFVRDLLPA